jgi:colanic acid biosynthesis glycosyl transferase WcaI
VRILFLNQTFHPDVASTAQHASDLAASLVERGHDVVVVCSRRAYDDPGERYPRHEDWCGVQIRRIWTSGLGKKARWRRAIDFGSYLANCLVHLAALPRFDLVVAMTSPPLISWFGALFTAMTGGRFLFWVMDLNPDEALAAGWMRPDSWTAKRLAAMLNYSLRRATTVVALDRFMARRLEEKGIPADKIVTLPPWSHDEIVRYDAEGRARFRKEHGLDGKYVVMYSGNHSPCHPLTTLLEAARELRRREEIRFCFVGGGSEFETVKRYAAHHGLTNIVRIPYQPLNGLAASLSSADLHVVIMGDPFVGLVHPCKVYNIRALGIPYLYIGPAESHISELAPTFAAKHRDVQAVVSHIEQAVQSGISRTHPLDQPLRSQKYLVGQMVVTLERAGLAPETLRPAIGRLEETGQGGTRG